jgi:hypothetical protein
MENYIRFETHVPAEWASRALGVFRAAGVIGGWPEVPDYAQKVLNESLDWFNDNLTVPRRDAIDRRAVFWFRSSAVACVRRIWEIVAILREENVFARLITTTRPGRIVYADVHQIAAIPTRR